MECIIISEFRHQDDYKLSPTQLFPFVFPASVVGEVFFIRFLIYPLGQFSLFYSLLVFLYLGRFSLFRYITSKNNISKKNDSYKILKMHAENNFFFQIMLLQCRLSAVCRSGAAWTPQWSPVHSFRCHKHDWKVDAGSAAQYDTRAAHVSAICANHWREA